VWVTVRIHYKNPITQEWLFHDGIGAAQLQTAKGTSPADLANVNNGALSMAFPIAKTVAIKDACDHFGTLFGSNLNRKDTINYGADASLIAPEPLSKSYIEQCASEFKESIGNPERLCGFILNLPPDHINDITKECLLHIATIEELSSLAKQFNKAKSSQEFFKRIAPLFTDRKNAIVG